MNEEDDEIENIVFLDRINSSHISVVRKDVSLSVEGYSFSYVTDTADVIEFCYPLGIEIGANNASNISIDEIFETLFTYNFLFNNFHNIILNEYKQELFSNYRRISSIIKSAETIFDNLINEYSRNNSNFLDEVAKQSSFILSSVYICNEKAIDKLQELITSKLSIDTYKNMDNKLSTKQSELIEKTFKLTKPEEEKVKIVFYSWLESKNNNVSFVEQKNTLRDIIAINRVIQVNKILNKEKLFFLYHSHSEKSKDILNLFNRHFTDTIITINDRPFNIIRNKYHTYLFALFYDKDNKIVLDNLIWLAKIFKNRQETNSLLKDQKELRSLLIQNRRKFRRAVEDDFIKAQITHHENFSKDQLLIKLNSLINTSSIRKNNFLSLKLKSIIDNVVGKLAYSNKLDNELAVSARLATSTFYNLHLEIGQFFQIYLSESDKYPNWVEGKDGIKGTFHHSPILLFFKKRSSDVTYKEFLDLIIRLANKERIEISNFVLAFSRASDLSITLEYIENILWNLLFMLLIPSDDKDSIVLEILLNTENKIIFENSEYSSDYNYFLVWMLRRCFRLKESVRLAVRCKSIFTNDARFVHGEFLARYLKYKNSKDESLLEISVLAKQAIKMYENDFNIHQVNKSLICRTLISLYNSLVYIIALLFLNDNVEIFSEGVDKSELNQFLEKLHIAVLSFPERNYESYPEIMHTEAIVAFAESKYYHNIDDRINAISKINFSITNITKALLVKPDDKLYINDKKTIIDFQQSFNYF